jgi:putative PIN family toxin of toxin-antitoxin system
MGKKEKAVKVVLDTNILVSALLFKGSLSVLVGLWKSGRIIPMLSKATFEEFRTVLSYPKFKLAANEIKTIVEREVLPFFEIVEATEEVRGACKDPDDDKFISCALSASADFVISGDKDLCEVGRHKSVKIIKAADFIRMML